MILSSSLSLDICSPTVLGLVWTILSWNSISHISMLSMKQLRVLENKEDSFASLSATSGELLVVKWMNFHLMQAKFPHEVSLGGNSWKVRCAVVTN